MKALIVDDELNVRDVIRFLGKWAQHGITEVLDAASGMEAKEIIERERPEIIFTDLKMPKMSGVELMEWLSSIGYPGKMIIVTGYDDYAYMRKAIHCGSYDYLLKPIESEALNEALSGAIQMLKKEAAERNPISSGLYKEARKLHANKLITAACEGEPFDPVDVAAYLPKADLYDVTLICFYESHHPDPYIARLDELLEERGWGSVFRLHHNRSVCLLISIHGQLLLLEDWISREFDMPLRLVSGEPITTFAGLPISYRTAQQALAVQSFRAIHRMNELDVARRIHDIVDYVDKHYLEEISLDQLANRFFLSREYISRRFKLEKGMNLSSYIIQRRIEQAKRWLVETDEKMYSIAVKLGYRDEKYFSKLFKRTVGRTPLEYRMSPAKPESKLI
ncbi:response regulator [Paenibacillus beijingensis]|uniref:Chemotaxis protein CheY n=1 Tax=Paenibacillus beijingensis TaxID=1126833 RepID=A0A0D5NKL0_9BACL|nr:response regulator [Paenibacillus beijingensis]AJY75889.1 chemotaxis protein CheY [Paenibacillus beijingensis]